MPPPKEEEEEEENNRVHARTRFVLDREILVSKSFRDMIFDSFAQVGEERYDRRTSPLILLRIG